MRCSCFAVLIKSDLHIGHVLLFLAHCIIQARWNQCFWFHLNWIIGPFLVNGDKHIAHDSSFITGCIELPLLHLFIILLKTIRRPFFWFLSWVLLDRLETACWWLSCILASPISATSWSLNLYWCCLSKFRSIRRLSKLWK